MFSPISIGGGGGGGGVHQPEPKCHFDLYPTFSFLGGYIGQKQNVTLTCIQLFHSWGGGTLPANLR